MPQATSRVSQAQLPPPPASPRVPSGTGGALAPFSTPIAVPTNGAEASALRSRVSELAGQLSAATSRRDRAASQLRSSSGGADRTGIEERIGLLDKRIMQIETDIADAGRALSTAPASAMPAMSIMPTRFGGPTPGQTTAISIVGTVFVLFPLAIAYARLLWRRGLHPSPPAPELTNRLERIEQGIEVIALEVERISEGQRFVAQLMSDSAKRVADPVRIPEARPRTT